MMITVTISMQLVAIISATASHAEIRHFRGPVVTGSATQESLHKATEEAAKRVHEAAAAARKVAHGDGSDSFANYLEQSMMKLEREDKAMHEKSEERIAEHELDRKVQLQVKHAHDVAHERAKYTTPEQAYQELHETTERIRKRAHADGSERGDGSDSFANELEQSIMELEEEKHENEFKAHERHIQHEREREAREEAQHELQIQHKQEREAREEALHAQQAALAKEQEAHEKLLHAQQASLANNNEAKNNEATALTSMREVPHGDDSKKWANELEESILDLEAEKHDFEEKARLRRARHKLENEIDEELLQATQPKKTNGKFMAPNNHVVQATMNDVNSASRIPGLDDDTSNEEVVQSAQGVALFLLLSIIVFAILSWQKLVSSKDQSVVVPGLGKVNVVQSERMVMDLINGVSPNAGLAVYGDDTRVVAPLKSAFGASKAQGYGIFTL